MRHCIGINKNSFSWYPGWYPKAGIYEDDGYVAGEPPGGSGIGPKERYDETVDGREGLMVRVFPSGAVSFRFRYTSGGKRQVMVLGEFGAWWSLARRCL